jgi:hypothetical protein
MGEGGGTGGTIGDIKSLDVFEWWRKKAPSLSHENKDLIGRAYLKEIIGLSDEEVVLFEKGDTDVHNKVGMIHAGDLDGKAKEDYKGFYNSIREDVGGISEGDFSMLSERGFFWASLVYGLQYAPPYPSSGRGVSKVLDDILSNMMAYK